MRRTFLVYLTLLSLMAAIILSFAGTHLLPNDWPTLLAIGFLCIVSTFVYFREVSLGVMDFEAAAIMAAFLVAGPSVTLWALAIATAGQSLIRAFRPESTVFNVSSLVVASWTAFQVYTLLGGVWGPGFQQPLPAVFASAVFMFVNALEYAISVQAAEGNQILATLAELLNLTGVRTYMVTMLVGILLAYTYLHGGYEWALVVAGVAFLLHITLRGFYLTTNEAQSRTQQLEAVLDATEGALIMADRQGVVKIANRQAGVLLGMDPDSLIDQSMADLPALQKIHDQVGDAEIQVQRILELTSGPARFVHWYRTALRDPQGAPQGHIEVLTDVTPLKQAEEDLRKLYDSMISALTAAIDARDSYTHGHSSRVSEYAVAIARQLGILPRELDRLRYSALLHDIGKLGVEDYVLHKRGKLTPEEKALMMQHSQIGGQVLQRANVLSDLLPGVRWHHEQYAGGGYPDGLKGSDIPLDARIIGVADALDAMTSDRPYRPAMPLVEALRRLQEAAGTQFDPTVVRAVFDAVEAGRLHVATPAERMAEMQGIPDEAGIRPPDGKELSIFYRLSREDHALESLDELLNRYLQILAESVGPEVYMVFLRDQETGQLEPKASAGLDAAPTASQQTLKYLDDTLASGKSLLVNEIGLPDGFSPSAPATQAAIVIPLTVQNERIGVLVVEAARSGFFSRDDVRFFETLGQRLASAVKLVRYHERLAVAATQDELTGLYNHRHLLERLVEELGRARRHNRTLSIMALDVDDLQDFNDRYGHHAGDEVLQTYARILRQHVRLGDLVARDGGDEFIVVMPEIGRAEAMSVGHRLAGLWKKAELVNGQRLPLPQATWSVAAFPDDGADALTLFTSAQQAIRLNKRQKESRHLA